MMGGRKSDQGQLFYEFHLGDAVPEDHLVRKIDTALDLSWLRSELAPHYSSMGRPSIDPELIIRMLVVGYVFAIRSERLICREVQVNLAYRWFCKLGIEDAVRAPRTKRTIASTSTARPFAEKPDESAIASETVVARKSAVPTVSYLLGLWISLSRSLTTSKSSGPTFRISSENPRMSRKAQYRISQ